MSRRRLRVVCFSDEEEDLLPPPPPPPPPPPQPRQQQHEDDIDDLIIDDIETDFQTVTLNSGNPTPNSNNSSSATGYGNRQVEPIPLDISDEDLETITIDDSTNNNFIPGNVNGNSSLIKVSESPLHGVLERLGLRLRREWLDSCLHGLQSSVQGFQRMDDSAKAKLCFGQFLFSDMNYCGAGVLPPNVQSSHFVDLKGPFVLQVDEIVNISKCLRERYSNKDKPPPPGPGIKRCLKLSMTDGVQRVFGMEYRPIKDLKVFSPAGLKVAVQNVNIRHGLMLLVPENIEVLGGTVEELEAARQRLVIELNKPARGKRTRTGVVPPLAARATHAAWPPSNDAAPGHPVVNTVPPQASGQGYAVNIPANDLHQPDFATASNRNNAEPNMSSAPRPQEKAVFQPHTYMAAGLNNTREGSEVPVNRSNEPTTMSAVQPPECVTVPLNVDEHATEVIAAPGGARQVTPPSIPANYLPEEDVNVPESRDNDGHTINTSSIPMDIEEISMLDDLEHHFVPSRDKEIPFTYLANLSAKLAANDNETFVRGKIKCFLTGVKGFNYKQRNTYELQVYIDDGSLISEILIDHTVVQKAIGYSPHEVTSALESSDSKRASEMKQKMKQFQIFLVDFEGTMIVEMSKASPVPTAVEMNQGCHSSDALLLLKRVMCFTATQVQNQSHLDLDFINVSP